MLKIWLNELWVSRRDDEFAIEGAELWTTKMLAALICRLIAELGHQLL